MITLSELLAIKSPDDALRMWRRDASSDVTAVILEQSAVCFQRDGDSAWDAFFKQVALEAEDPRLRLLAIGYRVLFVCKKQGKEHCRGEEIISSLSFWLADDNLNLDVDIDKVLDDLVSVVGLGLAWPLILKKKRAGDFLAHQLSLLVAQDSQDWNRTADSDMVMRLLSVAALNYRQGLNSFDPERFISTYYVLPTQANVLFFWARFFEFFDWPLPRDFVHWIESLWQTEDWRKDGLQDFLCLGARLYCRDVATGHIENFDTMTNFLARACGEIKYSAILIATLKMLLLTLFKHGHTLHLSTLCSALIAQKSLFLDYLLEIVLRGEAEILYRPHPNAIDALRPLIGDGKSSVNFILATALLTNAVAFDNVDVVRWFLERPFLWGYKTLTFLLSDWQKTVLWCNTQLGVRQETASETMGRLLQQYASPLLAAYLEACKQDSLLPSENVFSKLLSLGLDAQEMVRCLEQNAMLNYDKLVVGMSLYPQAHYFDLLLDMAIKQVQGKSVNAPVVRIFTTVAVKLWPEDLTWEALKNSPRFVPSNIIHRHIAFLCLVSKGLWFDLVAFVGTSDFDFDADVLFEWLDIFTPAMPIDALFMLMKSALEQEKYSRFWTLSYGLQAYPIEEWITWLKDLFSNFELRTQRGKNIFDKLASIIQNSQNASALMTLISAGSKFKPLIDTEKIAALTSLALPNLPTDEWLKWLASLPALPESGDYVRLTDWLKPVVFDSPTLIALLGKGGTARYIACRLLAGSPSAWAAIKTAFKPRRDKNFAGLEALTHYVTQTPLRISSGDLNFLVQFMDNRKVLPISPLLIAALEKIDNPDLIPTLQSWITSGQYPVEVCTTALKILRRLKK